jgi:hypothetical protein
VTLTSGTADDTIVLTSAGGAGNNIVFNGVANSVLNTDNENLRLVAGGGSITAAGALNLQTTGDLTITSVADATFNGAITVENLTQVAGTGTTTLNAATTTNGAGGLNVTGTNMAVNAAITANNAGPVTTDLSGTLVIAAAGDITTNIGAVTLNADGGITTAGDVTTNNGNVTFDDATTLSGAVAIDTTTSGDILFRSTVATGGNAFTLDAGPSGDITLANSLTGGGAFTVRDGFDQSYQRLDLGSINIQDATNSVDFNSQVSTTGNINVTSGNLIIQDAQVTTALNLTYNAVTLNLGANITTVGYGDIDSPNGYQIYNTAFNLTDNATLTGNQGRFSGPFFTNGFTLTLRFNPTPIFPDYGTWAYRLQEFNPGVQLVAQLDERNNAALQTYLDLYQQYQAEADQSDILYGGGNVIRFASPVVCDDNICTPVLDSVSSGDVLISPDQMAANASESIGVLSRHFGPPVIAVF